MQSPTTSARPQRATDLATATWMMGTQLRNPARALSLACVAFVASCFGTAGAFSGGTFEDAQVRYRTGDPGAGWRRVQMPTANAAWFSDDKSAALLVNSHCEGVADSPLEGLTNDLLLGTTEREIVEQHRLPLSGREALESTVTVKLDGVPRRMRLLVLKKDGCVYDVVLDAPPEHFDAAAAAFNLVRDGLEVGPRKDHP